MIKRMTKHGNSQALVIDRAVLELLKISPQTDLEITTDGKSLTVTPVGKEREELFKRAAADTNARNKKLLDKLAE